MALASIVLCAGKGTRMKSELAKVLHPVLGRSLASYPLSRALELGCAPVVAVVGHQAEAVTTQLREELPGKPIVFALQTEQLGTAHAVRCAQGPLEGFNGPVLILYGDVPLLQTSTLEALKALYESSKAPLALITTVPPDPMGYGRVVREGGKVARVVEQKDCTPAQSAITECNAGIYLADARFLFDALSKVQTKNVQKEFYLTDLVELAAKAGGAAALEASFEETAGVNDRAELSRCAKVMQGRINDRHMKAGVLMHDPDSTFVEEGVSFGPDCELEPNVSLRQRTRLGRGVRVGQGSVLTGSTVGDGTQIKPYSVFEEATVGDSCLVGPFARLRPGTDLSAGVHIGNFVETKKTRMGKGSKANHLAYLGDAQIGSGCNVGAGTITCNYDGVNKHQTTLGDNVFIGSDTQLVAPVTVGNGAYVGAGSTVTRDVPPGSLAVSRVPQQNVEGWVEKKKARQAAAQAGKKAKTG